MNPMLLGTVGTAIEDAICLHAMTNHPAPTMGARGRQRMNGAFEAVEDVRLTLHSYFKTLIIYVTTYFTSPAIASLCCSRFSHCLPLSLTILARRLCFLDVL